MPGTNALPKSIPPPAEIDRSLEEEALEGYTEILDVPLGGPKVEIGGGDGADSQNTYSVLSALPMDLDPVASVDADAGGCADSGAREFSPDEDEATILAHSRD